MNSIKLANLMDDYLDVSRNARYERWQYDNSINSAIKNIIDSITGTPENPISNFQTTQTYQDALYTLQKTQSAAPTANIALYPADYRSLDSIFATIGGVSYFCKPTNQNKLGPLLIDSFRAPSDTKPYYIQDTTGFRILHGAGTVTSVDLNYLKTPAVVTIGKQSQLILAGTAITNALSYIAVDISVQNGVTYNIGDQFTAVGTVLTSGTIILASNVVNTDLPEKVQEQIAKLAASILNGTVSDFPKSAFAEKQASQS